ncbi:MAG: hypothetical protein NVV73_02230 [Cellvibrionaceae bacterium]|nr:hypothetical protein [Cellvibrionaceae bacterium]
MTESSSSQFSEVTRGFSSLSAQHAFAEYFFQNDIQIFPYSTMQRHIQALYAIPQCNAYRMLDKFCREAGRPDIAASCTIEYINEPDAQAYAASGGGFHHIAVAYSLPVLLQVVFQHLLSQTNPFSWAAPEANPPRIFPESLSKAPNIAAMQQDIENLLTSTLPASRWQRVMATKLAELALLFCLSHEIAHLIRGHAELAGRRGLMGINELTRKKPEPPGKRPISHRLSQAWELQADRTSLALLFSYVNNKHYKKRLLKTLKCDGADAPLRLLARVSYAVSFVFFIFGQHQTSVVSRCSHPSALTRQTFAMSELAAIFLRAYPKYDEDTVALHIQKAAISAESAWHRLGFTFGSYGRDLVNLPEAVRRLCRRDLLSQKLLAHHQWAVCVKHR